MGVGAVRAPVSRLQPSVVAATGRDAEAMPEPQMPVGEVGRSGGEEDEGQVSDRDDDEDEGEDGIEKLPREMFFGPSIFALGGGGMVAGGENVLKLRMTAARTPLRHLDTIQAAIGVSSPETAAVLLEECHRACMQAAARYADLSAQMRTEPHKLLAPRAEKKKKMRNL